MKKLFIALAIVVLLLAGCSAEVTPTPPANADRSYPCSVFQGFNFKPDDQSTLGYIHNLKIGDTVLGTDFKTTNPLEYSGNLFSLCGVLSNVLWSGGYAQPIFLDAQISTNNKNKVDSIIKRLSEQTAVSFEFAVYDYDPADKKYYACFHSGGQRLQGNIFKSGGDPAITMSQNRGYEVSSPENYTFSIGVEPVVGEQNLYMATSVKNKVMLRWGLPAK